MLAKVSYKVAQEASVSIEFSAYRILEALETSFVFFSFRSSQFPRGQTAKNGRTHAVRLSTKELLSVAKSLALLRKNDFLCSVKNGFWSGFLLFG